MRKRTQHLAELRIAPGVGEQRVQGDGEVPLAHRVRAEPQRRAGGGALDVADGAQHVSAGGPEPVGVVVPGRPARPRVERALGGRGLPLERTERPAARVDRRVEHEPVDVGREQLRVDGAEVRTVRLAQIRDALLAERDAHPVEVAGHADGPRVRQGVGGMGAAAPGQVPLSRDRPPEAVEVVSGGLRPTLHRPLAVGGRAAPDEPGVQADQVETGGQALPHGSLDLDRHPETGAAGPARVEEQGPDPVCPVGGGDA